MTVPVYIDGVARVEHDRRESRNYIIYAARRNRSGENDDNNNDDGGEDEDYNTGLGRGGTTPALQSFGPSAQRVRYYRVRLYLRTHSRTGALVPVRRTDEFTRARSHDIQGGRKIDGPAAAAAAIISSHFPLKIIIL